MESFRLEILDGLGREVKQWWGEMEGGMKGGMERWRNKDGWSEVWVESTTGLFVDDAVLMGNLEELLQLLGSSLA